MLYEHKQRAISLIGFATVRVHCLSPVIGSSGVLVATGRDTASHCITSILHLPKVQLLSNPSQQAPPTSESAAVSSRMVSFYSELTR